MYSWSCTSINQARIAGIPISLLHRYTEIERVETRVWSNDELNLLHLEYPELLKLLSSREIFKKIYCWCFLNAKEVINREERSRRAKMCSKSAAETAEDNLVKKQKKCSKKSKKNLTGQHGMITMML